VLADNQPAVQPSVTYYVGMTGLFLNVWCSFAMAKHKEYQDLDEIDLTVNYDLATSEYFSLSTGFTNYGFYLAENFNAEDHTSKEMYISVGLPNETFSPNLTAYYDFDLGDGLYLLLGGDYSLNVTKKLNLDLSASLGYNAGQYLADDVEGGISDLNLSVGFPMKNNNVSFYPFVSYTAPRIKELNNDTSEFWFGLSVGL